MEEDRSGLDTVPITRASVRVHMYDDTMFETWRIFGLAQILFNIVVYRYHASSGGTVLVWYTIIKDNVKENLG